MDRDKWLVERQKGLGGSDAAAALGLSKWKTPYQLFLEKRGEAPPIEETEPMRWGKLLEPVVIQHYSNVTGRSVAVDPYKMQWHPTLPFMFTTLDGRAEGRVIEAKTARAADGWGEPGSDEIPQEYLIQVQHALIVTALPVADVPVLFGGQDFRIYEVPADRELQDMVLDGEADFWKRVQQGQAPDPVNSADVNLRWGRRSVPNSVQASTDIMAAVARLRWLKEQIALGEGERERLEVGIKSFLAENEALLAGRDTLATWKLSKPALRFDKDAFKAENPDLYASYCRECEATRRFLLK